MRSYLRGRRGGGTGWTSTCCEAEAVLSTFRPNNSTHFGCWKRFQSHSNNLASRVLTARVLQYFNGLRKHLAALDMAGCQRPGLFLGSQYWAMVDNMTTTPKRNI